MGTRVTRGGMGLRVTRGDVGLRITRGAPSDFERGKRASGPGLRVTRGDEEEESFGSERQSGLLGERVIMEAPKRERRGGIGMRVTRSEPGITDGSFYGIIRNTRAAIPAPRAVDYFGRI